MKIKITAKDAFKNNISAQVLNKTKTGEPGLQPNRGYVR